MSALPSSLPPLPPQALAAIQGPFSDETKVRIVTEVVQRTTAPRGRDRFRDEEEVQHERAVFTVLLGGRLASGPPVQCASEMELRSALRRIGAEEYARDARARMVRAVDPKVLAALAPGVPTGEDDAWLAEQLARFAWQVIDAQLDDEQKVPLTLTILGWSTREVAEALQHLSYGKITRRIASGRIKLRSLVRGHLEEWARRDG